MLPLCYAAPFSMIMFELWILSLQLKYRRCLVVNHNRLRVDSSSSQIKTRATTKKSWFARFQEKNKKSVQKKLLFERIGKKNLMRFFRYRSTLTSCCRRLWSKKELGCFCLRRFLPLLPRITSWSQRWTGLSCTSRSRVLVSVTLVASHQNATQILKTVDTLCRW